MPSSEQVKGGGEGGRQAGKPASPGGAGLGAAAAAAAACDAADVLCFGGGGVDAGRGCVRAPCVCGEGSLILKEREPQPVVGSAPHLRLSGSSPTRYCFPQHLANPVYFLLSFLAQHRRSPPRFVCIGVLVCFHGCGVTEMARLGWGHGPLAWLSISGTRQSNIYREMNVLLFMGLWASKPSS